MIVHDTLYIGGQWRRSTGNDSLDVISPTTEELVGRVPLGTSADIDLAVSAARQAFDVGPWRHMSVDDRRATLRRAGEFLEVNADELDRLITSENGVIIRIRQGHTAGHFSYYSGLSLPEPEYRVGPEGRAALVVHEPVGVIGAVMPWNAPMNLTLHTVLPALLAGCTVVLKPAPETPLYSYPLAQAFHDAGLPEGVFNVVACDRDVAETLVRHPDVDMISFVGSTATGRRIGAICGEHIKRVRLELGGKSAAVILDDAEPGAVAPAVLNGGMLLNNGEACTAWTRILVPRHRHDEFLDAFCDVARNTVVGDPMDPVTDLGPLISSRQRARVEGYIALGQEEGARVVLGGGRPMSTDRGWFVEPTIFADGDNSMRISREEIFGPVVVVIPYDDDDEALRIANDSPYGLAGAVFTSDHARGVALAAGIRAGTVGVNGLGFGFAFPFGGFKQSGIGREHGPESVREMLEPKVIGLPGLHDPRTGLPVPR